MIDNLPGKPLEKSNVILAYKGSITMELISQLMKLAEAVMISHSVNIKQQRSIVNIFIEALQNIYYHGDFPKNEDVDGEGKCLLLFERDEDTYSLITGNYIKNDTIQALKNKLEVLSPMSLKELNECYLNTLGSVEISKNGGGAGLGLMKILIDSKKQTSFGFEMIDEQYSFFTLQIKVSK